MSSQLYNLPNEILLKIFSHIKDEKNLLLVCKKFHHLMTYLNEFNINLELKSDFVINSSFNFDKLLTEASTLDIIFDSEGNIKRFDEKFTLFLEYYGNKINSFTHRSPTTLEMKKFIHLMPNLNILIIEHGFETSLINAGIEKFSIRLKRLEISKYDDDFLNIFDVEELKFQSCSERVKKTKFSCIASWKNLKKISISHWKSYPEIIKILSTKKLESLEIFMYDFAKKKFIKFIKTQKQLKEFEINANVKKELLLNICENFINLEKLNLNFIRNLKPKIFSNISKLKNLKSLTMKEGLDAAAVEEVSKISLSNLESLNIGMIEEIENSKEIFQNFARNFSNLKSFEIVLPTKSENYQKIITEILKNFNKVERLKVNIFHNSSDKVEIDENFYKTQHTNPNLKCLKIRVDCFDLEKLKEKLLRDFPNLEEFPDHKEFSQFQKIQSFCLNSTENVDELVKDCSISMRYERYRRTFCNAVKDGRKEFKFFLDKYFIDQQLKATLNSPRKLKSIKLDYSKVYNENQIENYLNYLTAVGQNITELSISNNYAELSIIKRIIESFPNLQIVNFLNVNFRSKEKEIFKVKNEKIKKVFINFIEDFTGIYSSDISESHENFCNYFRFPCDTLEYFKISIIINDVNQPISDKTALMKFLENQNKLTEKGEGE